MPVANSLTRSGPPALASSGGVAPPRLEAQAGHVGNHGDEPAVGDERRQEGADEEAADLRRGVTLEDEPRAQPHDAQLGMVLLQTVEGPLARRLVARVERGGD